MISKQYTGPDDDGYNWLRKYVLAAVLVGAVILLAFWFSTVIAMADPRVNYCHRFKSDVTCNAAPRGCVWTPNTARFGKPQGGRCRRTY